MIDNYIVCKICSIKFLFNNKKSSNKKGCCSYTCLKKTSEYRIDFIKSALKNKNIKYDDNEEVSSLIEKYSNMMSSITKNSTIKKHNTIKKKYGNLSNSYRNAGNKSKITRYKNFLLNNKIISELDVISDEEMYILFVKYYNKISNHGKKVINGKKLKHKTEEELKLSYKNGILKQISKFYNVDYDNMHNLNEEQISNLIKKYFRDIKFYNSDPIKWKLTHLKNLKLINEDNYDDNIINKLYSEYLSKRFSTNSLHVINNGYKKTKKGWYKFSNINLEFFYRSSWEEIVLKKLDNLILQKLVTNIFEPKRVQYCCENLNRNYFPDIGYVLNNNLEVILEIKPLKKLSEDLNKEKIKALRGTNYMINILTENEIFSDYLDDILLLKTKAGDYNV